LTKPNFGGPDGSINLLDVFCDINYDGINLNLETMLQLSYDDMYHIWKRIKTQKEYEAAQIKKANKK